MLSKPLYVLGRILIQIYARLMLRMDIHWHDDLPFGPTLFAANHPSATDPFLIHLISSRPMSVMITNNAFTVPLFGFFLRRTKQIPVVPDQAGEAFVHARQMIYKGHSVVIFPEGHLSPQEGGCLPPRSGVARLALSTGVKVVPVGIYLPRERMIHITSGISGKQTAAHWHLRGPYSITVGKPMQFDGNAEDREQVRSVSQHIMQHIQSLAKESELRMTKRRMKPANSPA